MKVLLLPDNLYEYLQHVIRAHAGAGIDPEEGLAIYQLNNHIGQAQTVDTTSLGKVKLDKLGPEGISLTIAPEESQPGTAQQTCLGEGCTPDNPCSFCANEVVRG